MEFDSLFAVKALAGVVGFGVGLCLGSVLAAIWLRLAALWLGFGNVRYGTAFKCVLLSNFVVAVIHFSIGFNYGLTSQLLSENSPSVRNFSFAFSPIYILYSLILGLVVTAAIFRRTIKGEGDLSLTPFGDSFALASLYYALTLAFAIVLALSVYLLIVGILFLIGG